MTNLKKYDAIIFDLFGTLVDDFAHPESQMDKYRQIMADMASVLNVSSDGFADLWRDAGDLRMTGKLPDLESIMAYICSELDAHPKADQIATAAQMRFEYSRLALVPRPGTINALKRLKELGNKIGLISDCGGDIPVLWPETPFAELVDEAILSCTVGLRKPDPRIYELACDRLGVSPDTCVYVGDGGSNELTGADAAGMHAVLIRASYDEHPDERREAWAGQRISSLSEVLAILAED